MKTLIFINNGFTAEINNTHENLKIFDKLPNGKLIDFEQKLMRTPRHKWEYLPTADLTETK
jgi:hypothetical protein